MKIVLSFISILHLILKKSVRNFCFLKLFRSLVTKRPGFHTLIVKQNKEFVWILWSLTIMICLNWWFDLNWRFYCDCVSFHLLRLCYRVQQLLQYSSSIINLHDVCFSNKIMVCMMYAPICSIADQLYSAPSHTSRIIARLTPHDPLKTTSKILGDFSLMKFC